MQTYDEILFLFSKVSQMLYLFQIAMLGGMGHLHIMTSFSSFFFKNNGINHKFYNFCLSKSRCLTASREQ